MDKTGMIYLKPSGGKLVIQEMHKHSVQELKALSAHHHQLVSIMQYIQIAQPNPNLLT